MNVAVIGLGKVGLPIAVYFRQMGHQVSGFDTNTKLTERLQRGENPLPWEPNVLPCKLGVCSRLTDALPNADLTYIIVPTPQVGSRLSGEAVLSACRELIRQKYDGLIVIGSTLDPRDAREVAGLSGSIAYSPPLIRLGHVIEDLKTASLYLCGIRQDWMKECLRQLWGRSQATYIFGDITSIIVAKLAINTSLSLRIAWANEIAAACDTLGANPETVMSALCAEPRIGARYMSPGWPPGGPCLPRDLSAWTDSVDAPLAREAILRHAQTADAIVAYVVRSIRGMGAPSVAVLGLMYNPNAMDITCSQGIEITRALVKDGIRVKAYDPLARHFALQDLPVVPSLREALEDAEVVLITTAWSEFHRNYESRLVMDLTRGVR